MKKLFLFLLAIPLILKIPILSGCANIVPPQGGPRDSLPPILVRSTPSDSTRNFSGNRIVLTFNEFIDVQNLQSQLLVSPSWAVNPDINYRLNTVTIRLRDTLEANTTYTIQFGDAIRDYTEGNPVKGFTYTFSTGPYIDSMELRGNVVLAETGKIDSTLIVMLHTNPRDSAVVRDRPRYVTKLDSKGQFIFRNLPARTFYLYALKDEGGTRRYLNERQLFAFADQPIVMNDSVAGITLYAYSSKPPVTQVATGLSVGGRRNTGQAVDTRLRFQTNLVNNAQDLLTDLVIRFDQPLRSFDSTKLRMYSDSTFDPVPAKIDLDSSRKRITVAIPWKENTSYHLILDKEFGEDSLGKKLLKTDTLDFVTRKRSEYGSLKLRFRNLDISAHPVLQIVLDNNIYRSVPLSSNQFSQDMILPGEYELRILYDENNNGVWDPGIFFRLRKQPEIVKPVERRITVKPNWENDFEIQL